MSYETISVRMSRSDPSIPWGFKLHQQGNNICISTVDRDSLSDKAGMRQNDIVEAICGRSTKNMGISEAVRTIDCSKVEVNLNLQRYVTSHTCLPWTLTEKDNKLVVDEVKPGFGTGSDPNDVFESYTTSAQSKSTWESPAITRTIPVQQHTYQNDIEKRSSQRYHQGSYAAPPLNQERVYYSPSSYSNRYDSTKKVGNGFIASHDQKIPPKSENYTSSVTNTEINNYKNTPTTPLYGTKLENTRESVSQSQGAMYNNAQTAQNYSFNDGSTTAAYKTNLSGNVPLNQAAFIETHHSPDSHFKRTSVSPGGSKVFYHSPSSRTRHELSPHASIQHLQYNSPINMYSLESAAEQYSQQTGRPIGVHGHSTHSPAYLNSETRKLIEEQEHGRFHRGLSPSTQSSSFKRISQAVGEPVN